MAMIKCPDCRTVVSDKARTCVNCGYPIVEVIKENVLKEKEEYSKYISRINNEGYKEAVLIQELIEGCKRQENSLINAILSVLQEYNADNFYTVIYHWAMELNCSYDEKYDACVFNMELVHDYLDFELDHIKLRNMYKEISNLNRQVKESGIYRVENEMILKPICRDIICKKSLSWEFYHETFDVPYDKVFILKKNQSVFDALVIKSMYGYVKSNYNIEDEKTYTYLCELKSKRYVDAEDLYNNLYQINVEMHVNLDEDKHNVDDLEIAADVDKVYIHLKITGVPSIAETELVIMMCNYLEGKPMTSWEHVIKSYHYTANEWYTVEYFYKSGRKLCG